MERKIKFIVGEFYHLYSRGNNKMRIFLDDFDKQRFLKLLFACNSTKPVVFKTIQNSSLGEMEKLEKGNDIVDLGVYCLMPNHFHILIQEKLEKGISVFMAKLLTAYSMYFNKKYERTGKLFEGVFRSTHIDNDDYFRYLFSYIHLNPLKNIEPNWKENGLSNKEKARSYLEKCKYSSYLDYLGHRREEKIILNREVFPRYFEKFSDFENFIDVFQNANLNFQGDANPR